MKPSNGRYILNETGKPVPEPDLFKWGKWLQAADRHVTRTNIGDAAYVSTVFLGLDQNFRPDGPPILWETMVFGGTLDMEQDRCSGNREQAEAMHQNMVERVEAMELLHETD